MASILVVSTVNKRVIRSSDAASKRDMRSSDAATKRVTRSSAAAIKRAILFSDRFTVFFNSAALLSSDALKVFVIKRAIRFSDRFIVFFKSAALLFSDRFIVFFKSAALLFSDCFIVFFKSAALLSSDALEVPAITRVILSSEARVIEDRYHKPAAAIEISAVTPSCRSDRAGKKLYILPITSSSPPSCFAAAIGSGIELRAEAEIEEADSFSRCTDTVPSASMVASMLCCGAFIPETRSEQAAAAPATLAVTSLTTGKL